MGWGYGDCGGVGGCGCSLGPKSEEIRTGRARITHNSDSRIITPTIAYIISERRGG